MSDFNDDFDAGDLADLADQERKARRETTDGAAARVRDQLADTVKRVTTLVNHYHRDIPFRAPETVPEHQARLLNDVWSVLLEGRQDAQAQGQQDGPAC